MLVVCDLSPHYLFFITLFVRGSVVRVQETTSTEGGMGHGGLREETSTNRACIPRSRLHTPRIDRPPPPRSLEINPFLSAIAHWKDVCTVDPSVIDSRSPSRHITPHTTCETSKPTLGNTITVFANNSLYRRHLSISFGIHPAALFTASMLWLPSFPHYEGVMVAHRQPTFRCAQIHLKGTFEGY